MVVVTGAAGFIGSVLVWYLNQLGRDDILIVDKPLDNERRRNLEGLRFTQFMEPTVFLQRLESGKLDTEVDSIVHLGACSSTTECDAAFLYENNFQYSVRLGLWWERHPSVRFVYASSAATYGNGQGGYVDNEETLEQLRPLNMYGYSKHLFDLYARDKGWLRHIVGLKYFNVFGPNERHKGHMRSLLAKAFPVAVNGGAIELFESYRLEYGHGEQRRDFIYVKDAVAMTVFLLQQRHLSGIFNVGSGKARTWNDLAYALFSALSAPPRIRYIPMPRELRTTYQYHTEADMTKMRQAGWTRQCMSLEEAVHEYVVEYLIPNRTIAQGPPLQRIL